MHYCLISAPVAAATTAAAVRGQAVSDIHQRSPTTRKNARSPRQRSGARSHRFQRSQTILRHVGSRWSTRNSRQRRDDGVYFTTMSLILVIVRSAVVHRRLIFIDCWLPPLTAADERATEPAALRSRSRRRPLAP